MYFETMKPQGTTSLWFPSSGITIRHHHTWLVHSGFKLGFSCFHSSTVPAELSPQSPVVQFLLPFNFHHFYTVLYLLILLPLVSKFRKGNISHLIHLFFLPVNSIIIVTGTQLVTELGVSVFTAIWCLCTGFMSPRLPQDFQLLSFLGLYLNF